MFKRNQSLQISTGPGDLGATNGLRGTDGHQVKETSPGRTFPVSEERVFTVQAGSSCSALLLSVKETGT